MSQLVQSGGEFSPACTHCAVYTEEEKVDRETLDTVGGEIPTFIRDGSRQSRRNFDVNIKTALKNAKASNGS